MDDQRCWHAEVSEAGRLAGFDRTHLGPFPMPNLGNIEALLLAQEVCRWAVARWRASWNLPASMPPARYCEPVIEWTSTGTPKILVGQRR